MSDDEDVMEIHRDLQRQAIAARARGNIKEERRILDRLISFDQRAGLS